MTMLLNKSYTAASTVQVVNTTQVPEYVGRALVSVTISGGTGGVTPAKRLSGSGDAFANCWWTDPLANAAKTPGTACAATGMMDIVVDGCDLQLTITAAGGGTVSVKVTPLFG
jgi:hypothetical protein